MSQTLLSERDMSAIQASVPRNSLIQQIHGAGEISGRSVCDIRKEMSAGKMYRY